jgi:hypothetical protein
MYLQPFAQGTSFLINDRPVATIYNVNRMLTYYLPRMLYATKMNVYSMYTSFGVLFNIKVTKKH